MSFNFSFNNNSSTNNNNRSTTNNRSTSNNSRSTNNLFNNNTFNSGNNRNNGQSAFAMLSSKFNALPNDKKQAFVSFEKNVIQDANQKQEKLQQAISKLEMLTDIEPQLNTDLEKVNSLTNKLSNYTQNIHSFEKKTREEYECATELSLNIQRGSTHDFQIPPKFYWIKMKEFEKTVKDLQECMIGMESHLKDIELNSFQSKEIPNLSSALNASHRTTIKMAAKVKALHDSVQRMKEEYKAFRLQRFGDENNPFEDHGQSILQSQLGINSMFGLNINYGLNGNGNQSIFSNGGQMNGNGGGNSIGNGGFNNLVNGNSTSNTNSGSGGFTFGNSNSNNKPISWNFSSSSFSL